MLKANLSARTMFVAAMMASLTIGCSDAGHQRWNEFWGVENRSRRRTVRTTPNNSQQASNKSDRPDAEPAPANASQANPGDSNETVADGSGAAGVKEDAVDHDVDSYVSNMNPPPKSDYEPNDHMSKIQRQQDPNRHKRIENAAHQDAAAREGDEPDSESALARYQKNTGVQVEDGTPAESTTPARDTSASAAKPDGAPAEKAPDEKKSVVQTASKNDANSAGNENGARGERGKVAPSSAESGGMTANAAPRRIDEQVEPADDAEKAAVALPEIDEISVSAGAKAEPDAAESGGDRSVAANVPADAINPADSAEWFRKRIEEQEAVVAADPNNLEEQYNLRMMYLVEGQDNKARAVIPGVDADIQDIMTAQVNSLISASSTSGRDPATWATRQLESLEELRRLVKQRADLIVPKVVLCTEVEGYGRYKPIEPAEFKAGKRHRVLIYIEVDNFTSKTTSSGMYRTLLSVRQTLMTKEGRDIWNEKTENIEDIARRPRRDFYLTTNPIAIPKTLPPGEYLLKVEVEDVFAGKMNSNFAKFQIIDVGAPAMAAERLPE